MAIGKALQEKLDRLPRAPGVYLMLDAGGTVIYVGKAKNLKNRVMSYFRDKVDRPKTQVLVSHVADLDWIVTDTENEALVLECNLIKEHRPRYNIRLMDDKHYPYIKVTVGEDFPRVLVVRRRGTDGSRYFGPYTSGSSMQEVIRLIRGLFRLRTCSDRKFNNRKRPCLNHQIKRCDAPCMGRISKEDYRRRIDEAIMILEGNGGQLARTLKEEMARASADLEFERAARLRDQIQALSAVGERQKVIMEKSEDRDVIALHAGEERAVVQLFFVRGGKVVHRDTYELDHADGQDDAALMAAFIKQYYAAQREIPSRILVHELPEDLDALTEWLRARRGKKVTIQKPVRGEARKLVHMVRENAKLTSLDAQLSRKKALRAGQALSELAQALALSAPPRRIECYDISNIQGSHTVASMVVFTDGKPDNAQYRRFTIRSVTGPDDFASMREVLTRRFAAAGADKPGFDKLPDLVIIDGGKGQLSAARQIMRANGFEDIATFGLAKREELLFTEGRDQPIELARESEALYLVQRIRDEAHRFAITYHREKRGRSQFTSVLDAIPGIGPKRKKALLGAFGSLRGVRGASEEDIARVLHVSPDKAKEIKDYLG